MARREARRRALERMAEEVQSICAALTSSRSELTRLADLERERRLTADEMDQVRALRWRVEQLRWQLGVLTDQFEQVRRMAPR